MKAIEKPQAIITTTLFILLAIIVFILMMTGCVNERINGNRDLIIQERASLPFSEVVSSGSFTVKIIPSDETYLEVKGESNVLPYLSTVSNGTILSIRYNNGYNIREHYPVEVFVYTTQLDAIRLSGSGWINCGNFKANSAYVDVSGSGSIDGNFEAENLDASVSGSGNISLGGSATNTSFTVSGSGNIKTPELIQEHCNAEISGSGSIITNTNKSLNAIISGSGSVFYIGNPEITTHITGSGKVVKY